MLTNRLVAPLVGLLAILLIGFGGELAVTFVTERQELEQRNHVAELVDLHRAGIESELNSTLYLMNGLVAYLETNGRISPDDARRLLKTLYSQGHHIRNIGLAPGNRLTYVYPLKGNEQALGLYYPDLPDQWPSVRQAIAEGKPRLAGPIHFVQGGVGFVYRVPVFIGRDRHYWGILSTVFDADDLYKAVGIAPEIDGVKYALRGRDGMGARGEPFFGDASLFSSDAVTATIRTPGGTWQIAARPVDGWSAGSNGIVFAVGAAAMLLGFLVYIAVDNLVERLRVDKEVKASRDELNEAQRLAMIGSWRLDLRRNRLNWSAEIFRICEIDPNKFQGSYEAFLQVIHPDDRELVNRVYTESVANKTPYDIVHRLLFADGRVKYVRERCETLYGKDGKPMMSRGTVQDVTQLHTAEKALRASEERWKFALEGAETGVWDWNLETGEVFLSKQEMTVLGYEGDEATNSNIAKWAPRVHPDDLKPRAEALERYLTGKAPFYSCEFRTRGRDGDWRWIFAQGMIVGRAPDGRPLRMIGTHRDITAQKKAEAEIARLSEWNELLLNSLGEGIYDVDPEGRCTFINPAALAMLGYDKEEVLNNRPHDVFHHHHGDGSSYPIGKCQTYLTLKDGVPRKAEDEFIRKNGEAFPVHVTVTPMHEEEKMVGAVVVFQDISQRKAMERELIYLATTDSLTGAANRRRFLEECDLELIRSKRFDQPFTFLMLDVDHFKSINDRYGHEAGDRVLQHFATLVRQRLRRIDLFGRLGGEEFGILLPGTDGGQAREFADQFRNYIADTPTETSQGLVHITVSIGLAESGSQDAALDSIMLRADKALYRAKQGGRNQVELN